VTDTTTPTELNPNVPAANLTADTPPPTPEPVDKPYDSTVDGFLNAFRVSLKKDKEKAKEKETPDGKTDETKAGETKPDTKAATEEKATEPEVKADKTKEDDEPAPAPRKKNLRPRPYVSDDDRVARVAAEAASKAAAEVVSRQQTTRAAEPAAEPTFSYDLPPALQNELKVLDEIERISPESKGAKAKMVGWLKDVERYQQRWQESHPDDEFDENAPEHNAIFDRKPQIDQTLMEAGRMSLAQKLLPKDKRLDDLEVENKKLHARVVQQKLEPMVYNETNRAIKVVLGAMDKELEAYVASPEKLATLAEEDPVAWDAMREAMQPAIPFIKAAVELAHSEGTVGYNPKDEAHVALSNFAFDQERVILSRPEEKQYRGNLPYVSISEYHKLSKDQQRGVWSLGDPEVLINFRISAAVQDAKSTMELEEKKHKAREKRFGAKNNATTQTPPPATQPAVQPEPEKPASRTAVAAPPATGGARSVVATNGDSVSSAPKNFDDLWLNNLRGSR
jgi:hypothetical protein